MELTSELMSTSMWTDDIVAAHGLPVVDVPLVTIGGGLGSFALVDTLRIAGRATSDVTVLSDLERPSQTYEYLANNSQIPPHERLRSDSSSTIDCIWGWPGYALREAVADRSAKAAWQVLTEPVLSDYYTPRASQVYASVRREAERIGWNTMLRPGPARTVRKRAGGGYFVVHTPDAANGAQHTSTPQRVVYRAQHVHVAVGYPGVKFLPDLQRYRDEHQDFTRVVNAYEPHQHVYEELRRRPCTVVLRGSGIVASRILQRIIDDRDALGTDVRIAHLFRTYPTASDADPITFRRPVENGWAYQGFNYPKAAWGGQLRTKLESLDGPERSAFLDAMGGTNTAPRKDWKEQIERGAREGFYVQVKGTVDQVTPTASGQIHLEVADRGDGASAFDADFIIDATGLEADISEHRLLRDLLDHVGARTNPKGRLDVTPDFSVRGAESGGGRLFASGSITLGGYYAGVDSFLGLQYAALRTADALADLGFGNKIGPLRSVSQWWKWARKAPL